MTKVEPKKFPLHFVGIGGIGMSGIAEIFFNQGFPVTGSDSSESDTVKRLRELGITVSIGHRAENVHGAGVVVTSSAIRPMNPEVVEAKRLRISIIPRAEMLGELMRGKTGIALAGTHGKTTTTSLTATVLTVTGRDPTCIIGGKVDALGGNAKIGRGDLVVAEADESDGSFLHLPATYAIVTNIDNDHLDHYGSLQAVDQAFIRFLNQLPFYGRSFLCHDDPGVRRILPSLTKPHTLYGLGEECDFRADQIAATTNGSIFRVLRKNGEILGSVTLHIPGRHNVLNALGVIALCESLGIPFTEASAALSQFAGVKRRFETVYADADRRIRIVDDYGHHPTEIAATLRAARSIWGEGRILCAFQPHRYSRTLHCAKEFQSCFKDADVLFLTEIYSAGEDPIEGVTGEALTESVRLSGDAPARTHFEPTIESLRTALMETIRPGDLVLCMGAGSITQLPKLLKEKLFVAETV